MAAPMWKSAVEDYIVGISDDSFTDIVNELLQKDVTLVEIVESVGTSLTNPEASVRARGVRLLADITQALSPQSLNEKEAELLVTYMVERLKDHHSIQPHALYGIQALSSCSSLPEGSTEKICRAIFSEVYNQSLAQRDRRSLYQIMMNFLKTRVNELQKFEGEFVHGFIQAMDMEKDPRNLALAFQCVLDICHKLSLGVFVEEMFEVFSCYFPVDFTPPPGDVFGVKRDDLVIGLERCMSATDRFAPFCLPLLLEKISSDLPSAKIESFKTLIPCAQVFGAVGLQEFLGSLFSAIKREVFSSGDQEIEDAALNALTSIVKSLSNSVNEKGSISSLDGFLDGVLKDCVIALREPGLKLFTPTARLLQAMAGSSDPAFCKITHVVMPTILGQFQSHTQVTERTAILSVVQNFVKLCDNFKFSSDVDNPLTQYKEQTFPLLCNMLSNTVLELRQYGVTSITTMLTSRLLTHHEQQLMADHFSTLVLTDTDVTVREACKSGLACLGSTSPGLLIDRVLPVLVDKLQTKGVPMDVDGDNPSPCYRVSCLQTLVSIATHQDIVLQIVPRITTYLGDLSKDSGNNDDIDCAITASHCLCCLLEKNITSTCIVQHYLSVTVPALIGMTLCEALQSNSTSLIHFEAVIKNIAKTVQILMTGVSSSESTQFAKDIVAMFLENRIPSSIEKRIVKSEADFQPFSVSSPWTQSQMVCILVAVICSIPKQSRLKDESILLESLTELSLKSDHVFTSNTAAKGLAGLVNKILEDGELIQVASNLKDRLTEVLKSEICHTGKCRAFTIMIWLTKALVLRGHQLSVEFANQLTSMLEDGELGSLAADGFRILLSECDDVMTVSQHANVRLMYRQRIFIVNLPTIVQGFHTTKQENKKHYLLALSHLVTFVPKQVVLAEAESLIPLLVHSLLCEDEDLQQATLSTLCSLITDAPDLIAKHVDSLIPHLLKLSCTGQTMNVRKAGLQSLSALIILPPHVILPHKSRVVRALEPALDDRKRLVRKEAVNARGEWFLLGAPVKS